MKKMIVLAMAGCVSGAAQAQIFKYLEEKTVFCFSEQSLERYLNHAKQRNLDGLNQLVINGECNFVPDGDTVRLTRFRKDQIEDMPIIVFEQGEQTLWTFQALVKNSESDNL